MKQTPTTEVTFLKGFVSNSGEISGATYAVSMPIEGAQTIARISTGRLSPQIPEGTLCAFDHNTRDVPDGALVIAEVTLHTPALRSGKRKFAEIADALSLSGRVVPVIDDETVQVIRWLRRDPETGSVSLHTTQGDPITESSETSIVILGVARPDLNRDARFAAERERAARTLGYRRQPPQSSQGQVHSALQQLRLEEQRDPDLISRMARPLLTDHQLKPLKEFREAESEQRCGDASLLHMQSASKVLPVDVLCARLFRAGQLSGSLRPGQPQNAGFTLLDAEEIREQAPTQELVDALLSSALYFELLRQYDSKEAVIVWDQAGSQLTMPVLATRMFRAGQLSQQEEPYAQAA